MEKVSLTWEAPEYHHYKRSADWFWAVGIITICIAVLAFIYNNALFGGLVLLSAAILVFYVLREPSLVKYEINPRGVMIDNNLHPYITLEAYWIETRTGDPKVIIKSKKNLLPYIVIPIHEESVEDIDSVLNQFIEEKELQEPASHKVMEYLGF